ncbi:MAG: hypothetical protein WA988_04640 [Candidatus Nanopelagicales bacterium]
MRQTEQPEYRSCFEELFDPDGNHLAERNAELRRLLLVLNQNLRNVEIENARLQRSLDGARVNVKRKRERNITRIFSDFICNRIWCV